MSTAQNPKIGLDHVVIARLISDNPGTVLPVYDSIIELPGAVQASANPNSSVDVDYADNGAFFVSNNRANIEMSLEFTNIDPNTMALMLGQDRGNGITLERPQDQSPYFALGFRVWIGGTDADGTKIYEYFWYAKGKFSVPENGGTTKKDSLEFQHATLTAQFVSTQYSPDGKGNGIFCSHCRSDIDTNKSVIDAWFNTPVLAINQNVSAFTVAITKSTDNYVITGTKADGSEFTFAESSIKAGESIILLEDGAEVPFTFEISESDENPTITITPATEIADEATVIVTKGLKDVFGVGATPKTATL